MPEQNIPPQTLPSPPASCGDSLGDLLTAPSRAWQSWRDRIEVHPATEMFPMLSGQELAALAKDIAENGLQQAVVLWTPERIGLNPPTQLRLLDGRNRLAAIELAF